MDREHVGYVSGNPARVKILNLVSSRREGLTVEQVRKSVRMPAPTVENTLNNMEERGLLEHSGDVYTVTDTGERVARELQSFQ